MSNPYTPTSLTSSHGDNTMRQNSTQPSSPTVDVDQDVKMANGIGNAGQVESEEDMDVKAKALMHLLNTSEVFVAIMAEKMKKQQEEARLAAAKKHEQQQKEQAGEPEKKESAQPTRRGTRASARQEVTEEKDDKKEEPTKSKRGRGRKAAPAKGNAISNYFKKAEVNVDEAKNTSVQEALEHAADKFEEEPTVLGGQELVATQQPAPVTGGKMRKYQLEGLEWLKSLWMNGLCGILADEMGLGKTVQAISLIAFFKEHNVSGPFLISAPLSTVSNWVDEFARWTPGIKTVLYHGSKDERANLRKKFMNMRAQKSPDFPVVCTSYEICMNDRKFLAQYQWRYIIVDEGHRLKNMNCRLIKELMSYNSANRLLISGTPLQNNITELWSLLHFLLPEIFNDLNSFQNWFDFSSVLDNNGQTDMIERQKRTLVSTMHSILKPFLLRRVKTDVETALPKKREYVLYAPLTTEQKDLYREILNGTGRQYLEEKATERLMAKNEKALRAGSRKRSASNSGVSTPNKSLRSSRDSTPGSRASSVRRRKAPQTYKDISDREFNSKLRNLELGIEDESEAESIDEFEQEEVERANTIKLAKREIAQKKMQNPIMQARLACNSPHNFYWPWTDADSQLDETLVTASGKMLLLDRLIPSLLRKGHKILIFSQFKTQLDILQDWATHLRSWNVCRIDGAISQADRQSQIRSFNTDKEFKIFLLSTRAGGQGINLTAADTVILFDSDWNPQQDLQAQDRAHRIGQTKPVIVYRLATKGTVEQTLLEKADSKRRLERLVIQKGKFKSLLAESRDDVDELKRALGEDEFEAFEASVSAKEPESILSDEDLRILTDRSEEAYSRAEKGLESGGSGKAFKAVETRRDGGGLMETLERK
ncbi:putative SNF2 family helicase/ATPase PasG [Aspergillus undulatus]|uniref:putative SNF2 family helicase/ATPase PasG n=1 Tax=Aspergillus undulatus TaxID=1810928 RepID=UPI003CCE46F0